MGLGISVLSIIASKVQHWRKLTLLLSAMGLPFISYHWLLPESPRWLLCQNRVHEAVKILEDIAKGNGTVLGEKAKLDLISPQKNCLGSTVLARTQPEGLRDLFSNCQLGLMTWIQIFSFFVNSASYYGLTLAAGEGEECVLQLPQLAPTWQALWEEGCTQALLSVDWWRSQPMCCHTYFSTI